MTAVRAGFSIVATLAFLCAAPTGAVAESGAQQLLLEIWVNGRASHVIAKVIDRDGAIWINAVDLGAAGIKTGPAEANADGFVALDGLDGVHARLVGEEQRLQLTAGKERLAPQAFDLSQPIAAPATTAGAGFIGEYGLAATVDDFGHAADTASLGAVLAGTIFTPFGTLTANGFAQRQSGMSRVIRLDTAAEFDEQDRMRRFTIGDAISGSVGWSRSVRFAGLQIATDFALRPDLATLPLPSFFGQTAVPATVDVFVNSVRVFESDLAPGPFQIDNLPVVTGRGEARVVIRDVLGQETTALLPFFATNTLLREGLSSYDLDIGLVRRNYGLRSFDYGAPAVAGTYRIGATDWLTLETHGEASSDVQLAGGGAAFSLSPYGAMQAAAAVSNSRGLGTGALYSLSLDTQSYPVGFSASVSATSGRYRDLAAIGGDSAPPRLQMHLGANLNLARMGSLAASWIEIRRDGQNATRLASASYSLSFAGRWYLGATGFYDYANRAWTAEAFLSVSLDGNLIANAAARTGTNAKAEEIGLTQSVNPDGGFGYRLSAVTGDNAIARAEATWIGSHGGIDAAVSSIDGRVAGRLLASGGVVAMDGSLYATRVPNGAVALVHAGEQNARIFRENRQVATADSNGDALLTGLAPYTPNRISVDPRDYSFSTIVDTTDKTVVPRRMSGVIVDLAPTSHSPARVILHLQNGNPPPAGSRVTPDGGDQALVVGRDGEIFIADFSRTFTGTVEYGENSCRFAVSPPAVPARDAIPRIGPVLCASNVAQ